MRQELSEYPLSLWRGSCVPVRGRSAPCRSVRTREINVCALAPLRHRRAHMHTVIMNPTMVTPVFRYVHTHVRPHQEP